MQLRQALPARIRRRLDTVGGVGLGEDAGDVVGDGAEADVEGVGDLLVAVAGADEAQLIDLPFAEAIGVRGFVVEPSIRATSASAFSTDGRIFVGLVELVVSYQLVEHIRVIWSALFVSAVGQSIAA